MKKYDLNIKRVVVVLLLSAVVIWLAVYMCFFSTMEEKIDITVTLSTVIGNPFVIYIGGIVMFLVSIYMIKLLLYKRKDILIISDDKINYSNPIYGDIEIQKSFIDDIYISTAGHVKIICKNLKYEKKHRMKFWLCFLGLFSGHENNNIFTINTDFIKILDVQEFQKLILQLRPSSENVNSIIENKLKEYNISNVSQFKEYPQALDECIIAIYELNKLTQQEIALVLDTTVNKVSKTIRKYLNNKT